MPAPRDRPDAFRNEEWTPTGGEVCQLAQNVAQNCGFSVFPCREDKAPATPHGFKDAMRDPAAVADLWRRYPGPLIGVATGAVSNLAVLDIDVKHDPARAWWRENCGRLPVTRAYRTRSGGIHLYFRHIAGVRNVSGKPTVGVDVRGDGGYVIAWFAAGLECLCDAPAAPWAPWLTTLFWPPPPLIQPIARASRKVSPGAIGALVSVVREAAEGTRNAKLNWAAFHMRKHIDAGRIARAEAERLLIDAARDRGLSILEARATIASAWRA